MGLPPGADPKKRVVCTPNRYTEPRNEPYPKPNFSSQLGERTVVELSSKIHEGSNLANPNTLAKVVENLPGVNDPIVTAGKIITNIKKGDTVGATLEVAGAIADETSGCVIEGAKLAYDIYKRINKNKK